MRFLLLAALLMSTTSFAGEFASRRLSFAFKGDNNGNRIYIRCATVKKIVEEKLATLGAQAVQVKCANGLEDWTSYNDHSSMGVSATFEVPVGAATGSRETLTIDGDNFQAPNRSECFFMTKFLDSALSLFPEVEVIKKSNSCRSNYSYWFYHLQVAK